MWLKVHGNVCLASVVVTATLDWKLHGLDVLSEFDGANPAASGPMLVSSSHLFLGHNNVFPYYFVESIYLFIHLVIVQVSSFVCVSAAIRMACGHPI